MLIAAEIGVCVLILCGIYLVVRATMKVGRGL
jgi:hypothetical protein